MTVRHLGRAAVLGLALFTARSGLASEPGRLTPPPAAPLVAVTDNQRLAQIIADQLQNSGTLKRYTVEVAAQSGNVELTGTIASQEQREEVLRLVQGIPGVVKVIDRLQMAGARGVIRPVQDTTPAPGRLPDPLPGNGTPPPAGAGTDPATPPAVSTTPGGTGAPGGAGGAIPEPTAIFRAPIPAFSALNPPRMPPYAWPTYAPYNNFSRVGTPLAYPYQAFPFIGPVYPFPKVPLGWRSVKLEWDDGHWWYSRVGTKWDWWRLRYW